MSHVGPPLLEIRDLSVQIRGRDVTVEPVDSVSFAIRSGETVGLVGESGSGKTMTALAILRLLPPGGTITSGDIRMTSISLPGLSERQMLGIRGGEIGMIFQDPLTSLNPTMTIGRQVAQPLFLHENASRTTARRRAAEMLSLVGMPRALERLDDYPHQLSGGMRQRVMIAMALICQPKLLIADEPTTALDVTIQAQILELLADLKEQLSMAMLLVTHDMGVIAGRADRVMVMYAGQIVEEAVRELLFLRPRHRYTRALLEAIPRIESGKRQQLQPIPGAPPDLTRPPAGCRFAARCRFATSICESTRPLLEGGDHKYACFHPAERNSLPIAVSETDAATPADGVAATVLTLRDVYKEFPAGGGLLSRRSRTVKAVSGVSLEVFRGETFGLVGESGSGKTTVGRMIVGLEKPTSGAVIVAERASGRPRRQQPKAQLVFQDPYSSLDPRMRVGATLREPLAIRRRVARSEQRIRVDRILADVGLTSASADRYPHEFSGGQRQRIGLARALVVEPTLVVADEPVSALDVSIKAQILNLMRRLQQERELTMVVISHDLSVVKYLADRIGIMYLGKLVEIGPNDDIYERPAHPYTAGLLAAIPVPDPRAIRSRSASLTQGELPSAIDPPSGCRFRTRCPRARDVCAEVEPPLRAFGSSHLAACHFPLVTAHPSD